MEGIVKVEDCAPVVNKNVSIVEAVEAFLSECDIRANSKNVYRRGLLNFFRWVEQTERVISELTRADILCFKETLLQTHSNLTIAGYMVALRRFYEWAEGNKLYPNIARGVKSPKRKNAYLKEHLRENQIHQLLQYFEGNPRDYAIVNLLLRTGLRCVEVVRANIDDITYKGGQRILRVWGKGRDERDAFVVLTDKAYAPIKAYLDTRGTTTLKEPLFISTSNRNLKGRLTTRSISKICKEGFRAIGIDGKEYTAHSLRHTTAVMLLKNGSLADVQSVLRHASPATSQIYTKSIQEELRLANPSEMKLDGIF